MGPLTRESFAEPTFPPHSRSFFFFFLSATFGKAVAGVSGCDINWPNQPRWCRHAIFQFQVFQKTCRRVASLSRVNQDLNLVSRNYRGVVVSPPARVAVVWYRGVRSTEGRGVSAHTVCTKHLTQSGWLLGGLTLLSHPPFTWPPHALIPNDSMDGWALYGQLQHIVCLVTARRR
jgi:hypothetical protein